MADDAPKATLEGLLEKAFRTMLADIETGLPGLVIDYDASTQAAKVQPIPPKYFEGEAQKMQPIANVPVQFPGGGGYAGAWPLEAGDPVWLAFSGRPFDAWLTYGNEDADEPTRRRWSNADCVAYPHGPRSYAAPLDSADAQSMWFGEDGSAGLKLKIQNGKVTIGTPSAELLDLVEKLRAETDKLAEQTSTLASSTVATTMGPQVLSNGASVSSAISTIRNELASIKAALDTIRS